MSIDSWVKEKTKTKITDYYLINNNIFKGYGQASLRGKLRELKVFIVTQNLIYIFMEKYFYNLETISGFKAQYQV